MLTGLGAAAVAFAGLRVEDGAGCLDAELVDLELRSRLTDERVDQFDFHVALDPGEPWTLALTVRSGRDQVWARSMAVESGDCALLPALAAQSFEAGLSALPGWGVAPPRRPDDELGMQFFLTLPTAPRAGGGVDLCLGVTEGFRWQSQLDVLLSSLEAVPNGGYQITGAIASTGPALQLRLAPSDALRLSNRVGAGAMIAVGQRFTENSVSPKPSLRYYADLAWVRGRNLRLLVRSEIALIRYVYTVTDADLGGEFRYPEPLFRLGFGVEMAGSLRRGDVRARIRE